MGAGESKTYVDPASGSDLGQQSWTCTGANKLGLNCSQFSPPAAVNEEIIFGRPGLEDSPVQHPLVPSLDLSKTKGHMEGAGPSIYSPPQYQAGGTSPGDQGTCFAILAPCDKVRKAGDHSADFPAGGPAGVCVHTEMSRRSISRDSAWSVDLSPPPGQRPNMAPVPPLCIKGVEPVKA